jgi:hypothetical protein
MSSEIIQSVAYNNYDDFFNMSTSYFHKFSFLLFWGLFNDETNLRVRLWGLGLEQIFMQCLGFYELGIELWVNLETGDLIGLLRPFSFSVEFIVYLHKP